LGRRVNDRQGSVQARETIAHYQADMSHPPVKEVSKDPFPARGALHGMVVNAEHFPFLVLFDTENHVKGFRGNRALPLDLDVDGIHENDRVIAFQGAIQPLLNVRARVLDHPGDAGLAVMAPVNLLEDVANLALG
jgi:hypothetical protein